MGMRVWHLAVLCFGIFSAEAATEWKGGTGSWTTPGQWTPAGVPNSATADVSIDGDQPTASIVTLAGAELASATVGAVSITSGDELIVDGANLTLQAGAFVGSGHVTIDGGALRLLGAANLIVDADLDDDGTTDALIGFLGAGTVAMESANASIFTNSGNRDVAFTNALAIRGQGTVDVGRLFNTGAIQASGGVLTLRLASAFTDLEMTNTGSLRAADGGTLKINFTGGATPAEIRNVGGTISADATSAVTMLGPIAISGGTISAAPGGTIAMANVTLDGSGGDAVTIAGGGGGEGIQYSGTLKGSILNQGMVRATSSIGIRVEGAVTLSGGGVLAMDFGAIDPALDPETDRLVIENQTITGAGTINVRTTNRGTISPTDGNLVFTNLDNSQGQVAVGAGGSFRDDTVAVSQAIGGATATDGGTIQYATVVTLEGSTTGLRSSGDGSSISATSFQAANTTMTAENNGTITSSAADSTAVPGAGIVAMGGANVIAMGGGNVVANGGGNVVAMGGANVIAMGGGNVIALGGGNLVGLNGSSFSGSGTFEASSMIMQSGASLAPGQSPGRMTVNADLQLLDGAHLKIELAGLVPGTQYDVLDVNGAALLDGLLDIVFLDGFEASVTSVDTFTILTADSAIAGTLDNLLPGNRVQTAAGTFAVTFANEGKDLVLGDFVYMPIPEPGVIVLLGLGGLAWGISRRRGRRG